MEIFDDTPRAIPAADPFNPMPEPAWIGQAADQYRQAVVAEGVAPEEVEPLVRTFVVETLGIGVPAQEEKAA